MMAHHPHHEWSGVWEFVMRSEVGSWFNNQRAEDVEPWTEPKRKVKLWPALYLSSNGIACCSDQLFANENAAREEMNGFVRLLTEYPAIEVDE